MQNPKNPRNPLREILTFIVALFVIHAANVAMGMRFTRFGIIPRSIIGLRGIVFSPLLHGSWAHLLANAGPLAAMLGLLSLNRKYSLWSTTASIWITAGAATWMMGRPGSVQIGASGLIYGLATFLITAAFFSRNLLSALIALFVIAVYGGLVWGLLPVRPGVSWEGHLCGAIAGILVARLQGNPTRDARR